MSEKSRDEVGHEACDLHAPAIGWAILGLALAFVVIAVAIRGMFVHLDSAHPDGGNTLMWQPPEPHLQTNPPLDVRQFQAREDNILNSYGWVNQQEGIVRIP